VKGALIPARPSHPSARPLTHNPPPALTGPLALRPEDTADAATDAGNTAPVAPSAKAGAQDRPPLRPAPPLPAEGEGGAQSSSHSPERMWARPGGGRPRTSSDGALYGGAAHAQRGPPAPAIEEGGSVVKALDVNLDSLTQIRRLAGEMERLTATMDDKEKQILKLSHQVRPRLSRMPASTARSPLTVPPPPQLAQAHVELDQASLLRTASTKDLHSAWSERNALRTECVSLQSRIKRMQEEAGGLQQTITERDEAVQKLTAQNLSLEEELERLQLSEQALALKVRGPRPGLISL
jgi:hypothetical protein